VKLKYLESNKEVTIQITEYQTNNNINGIQTINHKSPLAISIMNKENGDKVRIVNTENIVEIIEILN
jgi:transcription elongation GreA/GreB family factor